LICIINCRTSKKPTKIWMIDFSNFKPKTTSLAVKRTARFLLAGACDSHVSCVHCVHCVACVALDGNPSLGLSLSVRPSVRLSVCLSACKPLLISVQCYPYFLLTSTNGCDPHNDVIAQTPPINHVTNHVTSLCTRIQTKNAFAAPYCINS